MTSKRLKAFVFVTLLLASQTLTVFAQSFTDGGTHTIDGSTDGVTAENETTVILTWESNHEPEFGYCIYRDGLLSNMAHETQYVDVDTEIGGHCYYLTALCNGGETLASNEYCVTSGSGCDAPIDLYFNYTNNNKVQLYWTAPENENVTGYAVYRKTEGTAFKIIKRVTTNTFKDNGAVSGVIYQYAVTAFYNETDCYSGFANSLFDVDKFNVEVDWSNTPRDLQAELVENEEGNQVNLCWKPAYQATSYNVMRNGVKIAEVNEIMFVDEDLEAGETYCYQVVAQGDGFEEPTGEVCVTVPDAPEPPVLLCSAPTNLRREDPTTVAHIAWDAPEDRLPDSYTIVIINHLLSDTTEVVGINDLFYEESISVDVTDKSYKVKAVYAECESEYALTETGEDFIRVSNLGMNENALSVNLYPNPTSGELSVEAEGLTSVSVYNLVGQCLMEKLGENGKAIIDLKGMQNGVYFVKVSGTNGAIIKKVVKM